MSDDPKDMFFEECGELLQSFESALLALEENPNSADDINELFRAAHTIKGTSGIFDYEPIVEFAHYVESLLDQVRSGDKAITNEMAACLLQCRDYIAVLVEYAVKDEEPPPRTVALGESLVRQLNEFMGAVYSKISVSKAAFKDRGNNEVESIYWLISLHFKNDLFRQGMDPLSFLRYLPKLGEIIKIKTHLNRIPSLKLMDPEDCYVDLEILFDSESKKAEIEKVFEFVSDECDINILPPKSTVDQYLMLITKLGKKENKIGEILVECGALSQVELVHALEQQKIDNRKIGDILIEKKAVHTEVVERAADIQGVGRTAAQANRVLRVDAEKLDKLINLVGELVIAGAGTNLLAKRINDESLLESVSIMERLVEEIRDDALTLRMVQIGETFNKYHRVVRDSSNELGKNIKLEITGAETELDKTVVEKVSDPLMHLIRNAMDHGIESDAERLNLGKPEFGTIKLNAYHNSGSIVVEVIDDGRGLSKEKITEKAKERGLLNSNNLMNDNDLYRLIFEPGFSTADKVTNLSGRGVGMDVVKKNIESLRGSIDIETEKGVGTKISISLPLTLAIIDGFLIGVGDSSYVVPLDVVVECIEVDEEDVEINQNLNYINLRDEVLPFIRLSEMFGVVNEQVEQENIVVVQYGAEKAGIVVDELLGEFQTVIKPLGPYFKNHEAISGATILGNGDVAVILDIPGLVKKAAMDLNVKAAALH